MSKIKILPEQLANQIAAGEVIERPASVVKELLENAIDAGAARISVQVEGAGTRLIRVIDDGEGMDEDDILLSLERHATSKLLDASQLAAIRTLGFRGEAIPSIGSVSALIITSRPPAAPLGTRVEVRFGRLGKVHEMGQSPGTCIEVRDLFGNVPARRKFLKTAQTELSHLEEVVRGYGLAHHQVGFRYTANGREVLDLPAAAESLESRVRRVLGRPAAEPLILVHSGSETAETALHGYLLPPEAATGAGRLRLFVNGRPVRDRLLTHAIHEGLQNFLMKGRRPAGVLFLRLPPAEIDVNVHPAKQEVRFRQPREIHQLLLAAVRQAMMEFQQQAGFCLFGPGTRAVTTAAAEAAAGNQPEPVPPRTPESSVAPPRQSSLPTGRSSTRVEAYRAPDEDFATCSLREPALSPAEPRPDSGSAAAGRTGPESRETSVTVGRCIGQVLDSYLLCEGGDGLVILDQHAVHERLLFEKLKEQWATRRVRSQLLLFPAMFECTAEELEACQTFGGEIAGLGVELQEFGGRSLVVKAVPAVTGHLEPLEVVREILARFLHMQRANPAVEEILAGLACKAAIKAGQPLQPEEMAQLLGQMRESRVFSHCPHGRPVLKHLGAAEIRKWFHRT